MSGLNKNSGFVVLSCAAYLLIGCIIVGVGALMVTGKNDSPVEQFAEQLVEAKTGAKIDFSPDDKADNKAQESN